MLHKFNSADSSRRAADNKQQVDERGETPFSSLWLIQPDNKGHEIAQPS